MRDFVVNGTAAGGDATRDLGQSWDIVTDMAIKLMPGGHPYHALAEAAANASSEADIMPDAGRDYSVPKRV
jgi:hypothetical protein